MHAVCKACSECYGEAHSPCTTRSRPVKCRCRWQRLGDRRRTLPRAAISLQFAPFRESYGLSARIGDVCTEIERRETPWCPRRAHLRRADEAWFVFPLSVARNNLGDCSVTECDDPHASARVMRSAGQATWRWPYDRPYAREHRQLATGCSTTDGGRERAENPRGVVTLPALASGGGPYLNTMAAGRSGAL
jgi:hypothetical protein